MLHFLRQGQRPHEVGEVVGQGVKLEPNLVVAELAARQPRPFDRVLAFLDVLLRFASLIVEGQVPTPSLSLRSKARMDRLPQMEGMS